MTARQLLHVAVLLVLPLAGACGDEPPTEPPVPASITVSPPQATLDAFEQSVQLTATVHDQNGQVMTGVVVVWTSEDKGVAQVDPTGRVTAVGNGSGVVTATAGAVMAGAAITVAQKVTEIVVSPTVDTLRAIEDTVRLRAEAADANGHSVANADFMWATGDTSVVQVDPEGLVTAVEPGMATITVTAGTASASAEVAVSQEPVAIHLSPAADTLHAIGDTVRLRAEAADANGHSVANADFMWATGDTSVVQVDPEGLVTAVEPGMATITVTAGTASASAEVAVSQEPVAMHLSPAADTLHAIGDTVRLRAEAADANGHDIANADLAWATGDETVAVVDSEGLVTAVGSGTATITVTAGTVSRNASITVISIDEDRAVLVALYQATGGADWTNSDNWFTSRPLDEWYGIGVQGGRVTSVDLSRNNLTGPIPPELAHLSNLTELRLSRNDFTGGIPPEFGELSRLRYLSLEISGLTGSIPPELGNLANLDTLRIGHNDFTGGIPPELGTLFRLRHLFLENNNLTGPIPPELGNLSNLTHLSLADNRLVGTIPRSFLQLGQLEWLAAGQIQGHRDLCTPGTTEFIAWLDGLGGGGPMLCNQSDIAALESAYGTTGGADWTNSDGWLGGGGVDDWYGVTADSLGRVLELDLADNGLSGRFPGQLGELTRLTTLRIGGNDLRGRLPLSLTALPLMAFHYAGTELCVPRDTPFRRWLRGIASHDGTGADCSRVSDREALVALYEATGGPNWSRSQNWLTGGR